MLRDTCASPLFYCRHAFISAVWSAARISTPNGGGGSRLIVSTVHRDADEDDSESVQ